MSEQRYLWDKSEPADAFVARLEDVLAAKRARIKAAGQPRRARVGWIVGFVAAAAAAGIVVWVCFGSSLWSSGGETRATRGVPRRVVDEANAPGGPSTEPVLDAVRPASTDPNETR